MSEPMSDPPKQLERLLRTIDVLEREHEAVRKELATVIDARKAAQAQADREEELTRQLTQELSQVYVEIAQAKHALIAREAARMEALQSHGLTSSLTSVPLEIDDERIRRECRIRERQDAIREGFEIEKRRTAEFKASLRAYESRLDAERKLAERASAPPRAQQP